ncbi:MAG: isochorismatase family protein [Gammaproteobacteria bacterium]|nr:isochorismatase family protein [Gammaproteobacteria bacterium]
MLCQSDQSQLLLIDIQQRLAAVMDQSLHDRAIANSVVLATAASLLDIPLTVTRQYPQGLGELVTEVQAALPKDQVLIDKTGFSCCAETTFNNAINKQRKQVIITGMESHVCVLQTAHELAEQDYQVYIVEDAVCSRQRLSHNNAIARMRQAGMIITNTESVLFEWLRDARHEQFKSISQMIK